MGFVSAKKKQLTTPEERGFNPSLFECIDKALTATIGKEAVATFYYYTNEVHRIPQSEFPRKPIEVLQHLKDMFGEAGYRVLEKPIIAQIRETFGISANVATITDLLEMAKQNYLKQ